MIRAENINYIYQTGTSEGFHALRDISLEIKDGTLNAIIGHTGSGKSTLIQLFNALLLPTSGTLTVNGLSVKDKNTDLRQLRKSVGLVFQYPEYQLFEETVEKDIAFGPKNLGLDDTEVKKRVREAAELVGLGKKHLEKSPFELSGGQKRRAAIAGVVSMFPDVLILDEPTAGLDPKGRDRILEIIVNLHRTHPKMIIIFVSHSMEDVAKTAENVYVMNKGTIAMSGTVKEVFSRADELIKMGLDIPQVTKLMMKLDGMGYPVPKDIYTLDEARGAILNLLKNNSGTV